MEQLICGSPVLDFYALERAAQYDHGYSTDDPVIRSVPFPLLPHHVVRWDAGNYFSSSRVAERRGVGSIRSIEDQRHAH